MENQKSERCLSLDNFTDIANIEAEIIKLISDDLGDYALYEQFKNSKITKREVKVGISDETYYEVTSGLSLGDNIISIVDETLKDGQKIKIADPKKPKKDNKKIIKSQDVESVPAGEAAPGGPGPM